MQKKVTAFTSASRAAGTFNSSDIVTYPGAPEGMSASIVVYTNVTVGAGTSLTVSVQGKDPISGTYVTLTDGTNAATTNYTTGTGLAILAVGPGLLSKASATGGYGATQTLVPNQFRIQAVVTGSNPTFSVAVEVC